MMMMMMMNQVQATWRLGDLDDFNLTGENLFYHHSVTIEISTQVPEAVFKNKGTKGKKDEEGEGGDGEKSLDEETKRKLDALDNLVPLWYQFISNQLVITDELQTPTCLKPSSLRFKQKACNMVRTHVKLIVEETHVLSWVSILSPAIIIGIFFRFQDNVQSMITALSTTAYPKWKGEVDPETHLGSFHCIVGSLSNQLTFWWLFIFK